MHEKKNNVVKIIEVAEAAAETLAHAKLKKKSPYLHNLGSTLGHYAATLQRARLSNEQGTIDAIVNSTEFRQRMNETRLVFEYFEKDGKLHDRIDDRIIKNSDSGSYNNIPRFGAATLDPEIYKFSKRTWASGGYKAHGSSHTDEIVRINKKFSNLKSRQEDGVTPAILTPLLDVQDFPDTVKSIYELKAALSPKKSR